MSGLETGFYRHYKGPHYEVLGLAHHSETLEPLVVYKALYETKFGHDSLWVRPEKMFREMVLLEGREVPRFQYVGKELPA